MAGRDDDTIPTYAYFSRDAICYLVRRSNLTHRPAEGYKSVIGTAHGLVTQDGAQSSNPMEAPVHVVIVALLTGLFSATGLCWLVFRRFIRSEHERLMREQEASRNSLREETARRDAESALLLKQRQDELETAIARREELRRSR